MICVHSEINLNQYTSQQKIFVAKPYVLFFINTTLFEVYNHPNPLGLRVCRTSENPAIDSFNQSNYQYNF